MDLVFVQFCLAGILLRRVTSQANLNQEYKDDAENWQSFHHHLNSVYILYSL